MKKAFIISAAAFIAIGAAVSSSTKAKAEDARGGGVNIVRPAPVPPSAAPPVIPSYHRHSYHRRHYYHHHRRYY